MTRDKLKSLGHTDAQLDGWYEKYFGGKMGLAAETKDTRQVQVRRKRAFDAVMVEWQGVYRGPPLPKIGAFSETDAAVHESFRNKES